MRTATANFISLWGRGRAGLIPSQLDPSQAARPIKPQADTWTCMVSPTVPNQPEEKEEEWGGEAD